MRQVKRSLAASASELVLLQSSYKLTQAELEQAQHNTQQSSSLAASAHSLAVESLQQTKRDLAAVTTERDKLAAERRSCALAAAPSEHTEMQHQLDEAQQALQVYKAERDFLANEAAISATQLQPGSPAVILKLQQERDRLTDQVARSKALQVLTG